MLPEILALAAPVQWLLLPYWLKPTALTTMNFSQKSLGYLPDPFLSRSGGGIVCVLL